MFVASLGCMKITTKIQIAAATCAVALVSAGPAQAAFIEPFAAEIEDPKPKPKPEKQAEPAVPQPQNGMIEGVSVATLESIAACESGGDPTAVNAAGYYGKYQFDEATWASVGGSGNPAEASEAEQDYRAALLYSRAGSSPWPVCGA